jgi:signal peptide peptidase SppA
MTGRALALAASIPWAISQEWLTAILQIANREGDGPEAVAARLGRPLDNTRKVAMRDGVAVVPVVGPVFRRANLFSEVSGATSTEVLALDLTRALEDPAVEAIVLDIDSPGGEASGIHELAEMIASARGQKPLVAYVGGTGASAAYWIAAAADEVVLDRTARVGSIGVVMALPNPDAKSAGEIEIVSSQSPRKRPDVRTESGRAVVQSTVDAMAQVFVETVARYRDTTVEKVLSDFGAGGVLVGEAAVEAGMADRLGSLEETIDGVRERARKEQKMSMTFAMLVATTLGLAASASEAEVVSEAQRLKGGSDRLQLLTGKGSLEEALGAVEGMKVAAAKGAEDAAELASLRAAQTRASIEQLVDGGIRDGKITPASRARFVELGTSMGPDYLRALVGELPKAVNVAGGAVAGEAPPGATEAVTLTADELATCKRRGWDPKDYAAEKARVTRGVKAPIGG